jgi:hypothetical protein
MMNRIHEINIFLEQQQKIQREFSIYSKGYRESLEKEIELLKQKKEILESQF